MKLNNKGLENKNAWEAAGYALPQYDREAVAARTKQNPFWIHFGAGNIFRAFQANVVQDLLNKGDLDRGLVVAEGYDYEIVEKMNHPHDDYSILVTLKANGTVEKTVVGSVMESLALDSEDDAQFSRLNGLADEAFETYVKTSGKVSFPWTMIDKITPRPDASIEEILKKDGVEELDPVVTSKNTYVAPFVNAEECQYLVIEDNFPNGRPALEKGGLIFTTRETVDKVEKMKVCTCLNPLHTALAVYGCLLGYNLISEEMKNPSLKKLVEVIGYKEGLPVVINPGILDPKEFIDTVLNVRIPNPFMPDTPQRIATDTSQKLAIRFGETIKAYAAAPSLNVADLKLIPLVFAGWLRYLMGVDDNGNAFTPSPDPMLAEASSYVADVKLGEAFDAKKTLAPILSNAKIWGVDLCALGMDTLVCDYFTELTAGTGAVAATLAKYTA